MGHVVIDIDQNDRITYSAPGFRQLTLYRPDLIAAAFVAREWHGGQWSSLYRLGCGDLDYETVCDAANELARAIERVPAPLDDETWDADGMIEAQSALETLERVSSFDFGTDASE